MLGGSAAGLGALERHHSAGAASALAARRAGETRTRAALPSLAAKPARGMARRFRASATFEAAAARSERVPAQR